MDDQTSREELRLKLFEAEKALKEAEEEYEIYVKQLENYKKVINEQKELILAIKSRMNSTLQWKLTFIVKWGSYRFSTSCTNWDSIHSYLEKVNV